MIEKPGGRIGWRISHGCFWVGALEASDPSSVAALVLRVRAIARRLGFGAIRWQIYPETGGAMLRALKRGRAKVDFVQMYCEV